MDDQTIEHLWPASSDGSGAGGTGHEVSSGERENGAQQREELAEPRDMAAEVCDNAAAELDRAAERFIRELADLNRKAAAAQEAVLSIIRREAAAARSRAADDRRQAKLDREAAATERRHLSGKLKRAAYDRLTGTFHRGTGEIVLRRELERAKRSDGEGMVLGFFDLDGLKLKNERHGHAAGDKLLLDFVVALRANLRVYDLLVRWGGDEFICAIPEADVNIARRRIDLVRERFAEQHPGASFSVGLAVPRDEDTLESLLGRADNELMRAKRSRRNEPADE